MQHKQQAQASLLKVVISSLGSKALLRLTAECTSSFSFKTTKSEQRYLGYAVTKSTGPSICCEGPSLHKKYTKHVVKLGGPYEKLRAGTLVPKIVSQTDTLSTTTQLRLSYLARCCSSN